MFRDSHLFEENRVLRWALPNNGNKITSFIIVFQKLGPDYVSLSCNDGTTCFLKLPSPILSSWQIHVADIAVTVAWPAKRKQVFTWCRRQWGETVIKHSEFFRLKNSLKTVHVHFGFESWYSNWSLRLLHLNRPLHCPVVFRICFSWVNDQCWPFVPETNSQCRWLWLDANLDVCCGPL